jgi:hypothetical protein
MFDKTLAGGVISENGQVPTARTVLAVGVRFEHFREDQVVAEGNAAPTGRPVGLRRRETPWCTTPWPHRLLPRGTSR